MLVRVETSREALHGCRRLHLGEGAAPSPTGYTGDRGDPDALARKWWKPRGTFCGVARERVQAALRRLVNLRNIHVIPEYLLPPLAFSPREHYAQTDAQTCRFPILNF